MALGKPLPKALGDRCFTLPILMYVPVRTHHRAELGEALPRQLASTEAMCYVPTKTTMRLSFQLTRSWAASSTYTPTTCGFSTGPKALVPTTQPHP